MAVNEDHLLECLEVAIKAGDSSEKRRRKAMDTAAWKLLDKPWKGLLLVALDKEEAKAEEGNNRCLLYTSPSPRDGLLSRMPSSA